MGFSGNRGYIKVVGDACPVTTVNDDGSVTVTAPVGSSVRWTDEVTMFTFEDKVEFRKYGHDKSGGAKDITTGTWDATITLTAVCRNIPTDNNGLCSGQVVYLELYPFGNCSGPIEGYAALVRKTSSVDVDAGKPVEYTATFESMLQWQGLANYHAKRGGFECSCPDGSTGGGEDVSVSPI